ncbi:MAG: hypothetical protein GC149_02605 [Gammaproteobacteria bacterium]|nr:hypothetical protein [Gammaproteobacteria bacterium]
MKNNKLVLLSAFLFALFGSTAAYASPHAKKEINTAITHASLAEKMSDVKQVHLHLHHVINCLVGPKGVGFDASAGNPCAGMGNGAINDYKADKVDRDMLTQVLEDANYGLLTNRLQIARNAAQLAEKNLRKSEEDL